MLGVLRSRHAVVLVAAAVVAAGAPSVASAATPLRPVTGGIEIRLSGSGWSSLRAQKVRVVAVEPATLKKGRLTIPARTGRLGSTSRTRHAGAVQFAVRRGGRTRRLTLTSFETSVGRRATTSARVGDQRIDLFTTSGGTPTLSTSTGRTKATGSLRLTAKGARLLRTRLGLRRVSLGALGTANLTTVLQSGGGTGGGGTGSVAPGAVPPPVAPVAAGVPVTATAVTWRPREKFIQYISQDGGTTSSAGATDGPRQILPGSSDALVYSFIHTPRQGLRDPATGRVSLPSSGTVRYVYNGRIDLSLVDPTISLDGATGTLSVVYEGPTAGASRGTRVDMLSLDVGAATRSTANGVTTYTDIPAVLTAAGSAAFGGFYGAGTEFGTVTVSVPS